MGKLLTLLLFTTLIAHARDLDKTYSKAKIQVGPKKIEVYVADDDPKRSDGLMFIEEIPANTGMLFVFDDTRTLGFWMKNTLIPLSIGFFNEKGVLIDVQEMEVAKSLMDLDPPKYQSRGPAAFALEMNRGWFSKNKVAVGAKLALNAPAKSTLLKSRLAPDQRRDQPK